MRKTKFLFGVLAALCLMAFSAQAAQAVPIFGASPFNASNAAGTPAAGNHVFSVGGSLVVTCTTMTVTNGTHTGAGGTANVSPAYSGCTANLGGVPFPASVALRPGCSWTLTATSFNAATGAGAGTLAIGDGVDDTTAPFDTNTAVCNVSVVNGVHPVRSAVTVSVGATCKIQIFEQTISSGLTTQNYNGASPPQPHPAGGGTKSNLLLNANVSGIRGQGTGCPAGIPNPNPFTTGTYVGKMWVPGVWL